MKLLYIPVIIILYLVPAVAIADPVDKIAELIKQGNMRELAIFFAPDVEINILNDGTIYPKAKAELILSKFFNENRPKGTKLLHKVTSNPKYQFGIVIFNSDKGSYRITYTLKDIAGNLLLVEVEIEAAKN